MQSKGEDGKGVEERALRARLVLLKGGQDFFLSLHGRQNFCSRKCPLLYWKNLSEKSHPQTSSVDAQLPISQCAATNLSKRLLFFSFQRSSLNNILKIEKRFICCYNKAICCGDRRLAAALDFSDQFKELVTY